MNFGKSQIISLADNYDRNEAPADLAVMYADLYNSLSLNQTSSSIVRQDHNLTPLQNEPRTVVMWTSLHDVNVPVAELDSNVQCSINTEGSCVLKTDKSKYKVRVFS